MKNNKKDDSKKFIFEPADEDEEEKEREEEIENLFEAEYEIENKMAKISDYDKVNELGRELQAIWKRLRELGVNERGNEGW